MYNLLKKPITMKELKQIRQVDLMRRFDDEKLVIRLNCYPDDNFIETLTKHISYKDLNDVKYENDVMYYPKALELINKWIKDANEHPEVDLPQVRYLTISKLQGHRVSPPSKKKCQVKVNFKGMI